MAGGRLGKLLYIHTLTHSHTHTQTHTHTRTHACAHTHTHSLVLKLYMQSFIQDFFLEGGILCAKCAKIFIFNVLTCTFFAEISVIRY